MGVEEGLQLVYSAFYKFGTLTVHRYTDRQNLDLETAGHRNKRSIPVAERSTASVYGHSTAGIKGSNLADR